jgi:hypothetical protein
MRFKTAFASVGLELIELKQPVTNRGSVDTFFMDIERTFKRGAGHRKEVFRIYPGHADNRIQVVARDKGIGQLVLMVQELSREFWTPVSYTIDKNIKAALGKKMTLVAARKECGVTRPIRKAGKTFEVFQKTPGSVRHYLLGFDERQLFIAQLPRAVTTVSEAHASLKSAPVTLAEGKVGKATRQGEWFFLDVTPEDLVRINAATKKNLILKKQAIGIHAGRHGGNPHVADELLVIRENTLEHGFTVRARSEVYVRGSIRHVDHKTVTFTKWKKVLVNNEGAVGNIPGIGWID